jgi:alpha-tubulin suppressor-like RCC1 family protein
MHTPATAAVRTLAVATAQAFVEVTTGIDYSCGLTASGAAYCWGSSSDGQLGDGTTANKNVPTLVSNPSGGAVTWSKIAAGWYHTCAITTTNAAYCWGANSVRQLGDGTTAAKNVPTLVSDPSIGAVTWSQITAGLDHTCAITTTNAAYCWGRIGMGNLGDGTTADRNFPTLVSDPSGGAVTWSQITAGASYTCGITTTNVAYCWGRNNSPSGVGNLGDGTTADRNIPTLVSDPSGGAVQWSQIAAGGYHTCATTPTNAAYCWGRNSDGRLGIGSTTNASVPTAVVGSLSFTRLPTGFSHTCGLAGATTYCWGENSTGQLGDGTNVNRNRPTDPPPASDPVSTSGGSSNDSPAPPPPTPTRIPTPTPVPLRYAWTRGTDPASIVVTSNKGFARSVARTTRDPVTDARTFRGWVRNATTGDTYGVDENGLLVWVSPTDTAMLSQIDWSRTAEMDVAPAAIDAIPMDTPAEGRLLWEANGSGTVYVVGADRQLHAIPDLRTLRANYVWANVIPVTAAQIKLLPVGQPVPATT